MKPQVPSKSHLTSKEGDQELRVGRHHPSQMKHNLFPKKLELNQMEDLMHQQKLVMEQVNQVRLQEDPEQRVILGEKPEEAPTQLTHSL